MFMSKSARWSLAWVAGLIIALVITLFASGTISAPEKVKQSSFEGGETVSVLGKIVCLPHKNQEGPQTMECAFGLKSELGIYYGLRDTTENHSLIGGLPTGDRIRVKGVFRNQADSKYQQAGVIEMTSVGIID